MKGHFYSTHPVDEILLLCVINDKQHNNFHFQMIRCQWFSCPQLSFVPRCNYTLIIAFSLFRPSSPGCLFSCLALAKDL